MHHISKTMGTIGAFIFTAGAFKADSGPDSAAGLKVLGLLGLFLMSWQQMWLQRCFDLRRFFSLKSIRTI